MSKKPFKVALVCFWHKKSVAENLKALLAHVSKAATQGCDLVCFGEAVLSGMPEENPARDLQHAISLRGREARAISQAAAANRIWIVAGVMEKRGNQLYDTALLYTSTGELAHRYVRISHGWLTPENRKSRYKLGKSIKACKTPFGRFAFEICGDLFDPKIRSRLRKLSADYLFCPMWRSFESGKHGQKYWDEVEKPEYLKQIRSIGISAFFINTLSRQRDEHTFGGPMIISKSGKIIKEAPIGQPSMLICEIGRPTNSGD